jgi:hypothetical protein
MSGLYDEEGPVRGITRDGKSLRTRSVINLSSVCVKARDAISLWSSFPQFLERDSVSVSEYSCTFGFR